jgi:hypothetical protein
LPGGHGDKLANAPALRGKNRVEMFFSRPLFIELADDKNFTDHSHDHPGKGLGKIRPCLRAY